MRLFFIIIILWFSPQLVAQVDDLLREAESAGMARQAEIARQLRDYELEDFSSAATKAVVRLAEQSNTGGRADYVLLLGFLGEAAAIGRIAAEAEKTDPLKRAVNLARVRSGDADRRANLLKNVRRYNIEDDFTYSVLPLLVYTRQREVLDYLWQQLITENLRCSPSDAETSGRIDCAYRIAEVIAPAIIDFPVAVDEEGNLITEDYRSALQEIRRWYAAHAKDYQIHTNTY